ncbi:hypothetical protein ACF8OH_27140 [Delftia sp. WSY_9]|uniref:hypothetical protein n=1 Tax=unclassified Delftia TaxID=2613839 RepID=UPI00370CB571
MSHNFELLKAHILPLSMASTFGEAKREWSLVAVEISDEWDQCPCGQAIKEHCYIKNKITGNETYVGNVCVNNFLGIDTGTLFDGLKRIAEDPQANPNLAVIAYAEERGYLYERDGETAEADFLRRTVRKHQKTHSAKQLAWKEKINRRILKGTIVTKRTVR